MAQLIKALNLKGNPFEHYVAETEPNIADYAVKPPYFEAIDARAANRSSFILFGDRGSGKSATRITVFSDLWRRKAAGESVPLAVNFVDFAEFVDKRSFLGLNERALIQSVAFHIVEAILTWLATLDDYERSIYVDAQSADESGLCYEVLRDYYLVRPDARRQASVHRAMALLSQTVVARGKLWVERRWDKIAQLIGLAGESLAKWRGVPAEGLGSKIANVISENSATDFDSTLLMRRMEQFVRIFGFNGIVILIDKVDETDLTTNSADKTAALVHPILARVQLMEVEGFAWIFFLWSKVKTFFEGEIYTARLDKIGHATVNWGDDFFEQMLDKRINYFSCGELKFKDMFDNDVDTSKISKLFIDLSMRSPRELIRMLDVIIREHDILFSHDGVDRLLNEKSIDAGLDKYVSDVVSTTYGERLLAQIFRLDKMTFTNKDVQLTFKVGPQSARTRIQSWEGAGIIRLTGTRAAEGTAGGKPANEYTIIDTRIERIMRRKLISYDAATIIADPDFNPDAAEE